MGRGGRGLGGGGGGERRGLVLRVVGWWQWGILCGPANQNLCGETADSGISIGAYSADNNEGQTKGGGTLYARGRDDEDRKGETDLTAI